MSNLRDLQLAELEILTDVAAVCDKHGIMYSLAYGSLLGAVRHNGFIPWDDDIDILMNADDIDRFVKYLYSDCGDKYFAQTPKAEPFSQHIYTKVRKNGTLVLQSNEEVSEKTHQGIGIDVFPVVGISDNERIKRTQMNLLQKYQDLRYRHIWNYESGNLIKKTGKIVFEQLLRSFESIIWFLVKALGRDKKNARCCIVGVQFSAWFSAEIRKKERAVLPKRLLWGGLKKYPFENTVFYGPEDYDTILKRFYGEDYMVPRKSKTHVEDYSKVVL